MKINATKIPGCYEISIDVFNDIRGNFVKTFQHTKYCELGLDTCFCEEYYTVSYKNVLRGLHFQTPPRDHTKLVYCSFGNILDVVVDLRIGSPTYGEFELFELSAETANLLYIPSGLAHGFYVLSDIAIMMYKVTSEYSPLHDSGILWNSISVPWPSRNPIMSDRDKSFLPFYNFVSPFNFERTSVL